ncbi:GNAT family N-acetyltransferase [Vibrio sp. SCSIO 43135]|uniref:GNAT family N-acetyltransferase n=1 Tax=Vibrio sp. SCSIO 43135 TaxID=2819096 RepID=UPI002074D8D4|nr:GNAT family N-acetyltransferase [Vibrio sp. SCSIO 43135]USD41429.1 GNAT family N-acetyltransferase [Vibrio sp. SCSIO 43135]
MIEWQLKRFSELSQYELYELLKLRVNVFVVEQNCPYPELDDKDTHTEVHHLIGRQSGEIVACARLLPAGVSYSNISIGRIATKENVRGDGIGHKLVAKALLECEQLWPNKDIEIGAQAHLEHFYQAHGFKKSSPPYLEDGIPHIDMLRKD